MEKMTSRQAWALFCITGDDYRKSAISFDEASSMIKELNEKKGYVKGRPKETLMSYMKKESGKLKKKLDEITKQVSVIQDDPMLRKKDSKKYLFLGGGCGFAFLEFDRRSKKGKRIAEEWGNIKIEFFDWFLKENYPEKILQNYRNMGTPLEAVTFQDMSFNSRATGLVAKYMEENGVKDVHVRTHYD